MCPECALAVVSCPRDVIILIGDVLHAGILVAAFVGLAGAIVINLRRSR